MYNNYVIYDDGNDYNYDNRSTKRNKKGNSKLNIIIISLIVIICLVLITSLIPNKVSYTDLMIEKTKNYVTTNYISTSSEIFISLNKLDIEKKDGCNNDLSGVFLDKDNNYVPYLYCENEKTNLNLNNDSDYVKLYGEEVIFLPVNTSYTEEGITTSSYEVMGTVGKEEGVYNLKYYYQKSGQTYSLNRKVVVINSTYLAGLYPKISLNGDVIETLQLGRKYEDKGVSCYDSIDENIKNKVQVKNTININQEGEYIIEYKVTNSRGYSNSVSRKVVVIDNFSSVVPIFYIVNNDLTNKDVTINVKISGDKFSYIKLPDGNIEYRKEFNYIVKENGTYTFLTYDSDNNIINSYVKVKNIDKAVPKIGCIAKVYPGYTVVETALSSDKQVSSYDYHVGSMSSGYITSSSLKMNVNNPNRVYVKVKDSIGNIAEYDCTIKQMDPSIGNNKIRYYTAFNTEYVIAKTENDLDTFIRSVKGKISQSADPDNCGDACLSFAQYHAKMLQSGNLNSLNLNTACNYGPVYDSFGKQSLGMKEVYVGDNKQMIFNEIYDSILSGKVIVLQVTGTSAKNSRHFVTVVGYKRNVFTASDLTEDDLLVIDSWGGNLRTMDHSMDSGRDIFNDKSRGGYRVDKFSSYVNNK